MGWEKIKELIFDIIILLFFIYPIVMTLLLIIFFPLIAIIFFILLSISPVSKKYFATFKNRGDYFINNKVGVFVFTFYTLFFALPDLVNKNVINEMQQIFISIALVLGFTSVILYKVVGKKI